MIADFSNSTGDGVFDETLKQALGVSLRQSPFLNVLSDEKMDETLRLMTKPAKTQLTPDVAREVCLRTGSKAYIAGSIANIGTQYVIGLKAVDCQTGDTLALNQAQAAGKEKILDALSSAAAQLRAELGESLKLGPEIRYAPGAGYHFLAGGLEGFQSGRTELGRKWRGACDSVL